MTGLSQRPRWSTGRSGGGGVGGGRTGQRDVDGGKKRRDDERKPDSGCVVVICVGKGRTGEKERRRKKVRDGVWDGAREREREGGRETSGSKRLELCSPVVCTRWCSLIIHCMRWMSLSPHTALLHSALCLSAPGGRDGGGESCIGLDESASQHV